MANQTPLDALRDYQEELRDAGGRSIKLLDSAVRGEDRHESDLNILVEFSRPVGLPDYVRLKRRLTELLGRGVNLITAGTSKRRCFGVC